MLAEIFGMDGVIVLVVLAVVLFGGSQIPKLAHSLGSAQKEFKKGLVEGGSTTPTATVAAAVVPPISGAPVAPVTTLVADVDVPA